MHSGSEPELICPDCTPEETKSPKFARNGKLQSQGFNSVRGQKQLGFTMDPGAFSGLAGTDTKLEYDRAKMPMSDKNEILES